MKKLYSTWMIALVLMIPIYSSSAIAESLEITHISGADQVGGANFGYRKTTDTIQIHAIVDIDPQTLTLQQITERVRAQRLGADPSQQEHATSCALITGTQYNCTFTISPQAPSAAGSSEVWTVGFYPSTNTNEGTSHIDDANLTADGSAPNVTISNAPDHTSGEVMVSYDARDFILGTTATQASCAGIDTVQFRKGSVNGNILESANPTPQQNEFRCVLPNRQATFNVDTPQDTGDDVTICAVSTDKLGQQQPSRSHCFDIFVDTTPPEIGDFELLYAGGAAQNEVVTSVGGPAFDVRAKITIDDINSPAELANRFESASGVPLEVVDLIEAAFPNLHPTQLYAASPPDECLFDTTDTTYDCYWNNLQVQSNQDFTPVAEVTLNDGVGNVDNDTVSADPVEYIDQGPAATRIDSSWGIGSDQYESGLPYLGNENIISVTVESDAPLEHNSIALDLRQLGSDYNALFTLSDTCSNTGIKTCIFNLTDGFTTTDNNERRALNEQVTPPQDGDTIEITYLPTESVDSLGNQGHFGPERPIVSQSFTVDISDPVVTSYNVERIPGPSGNPESTDLVLGDRMLITFEVEDISRVQLFINLTGITEQSLYDTFCTMTEAGLSTCEIETQPISLQAYHSGNLDFTITDRAGNSASMVYDGDTYMSIPIEVLERIDEVNPDFWEILPEDISCSGPYDRITTSLAPLDVYCRIVPETTTPDAEGYSISSVVSDDCIVAESGVSATAYLEEAQPKLINVYEGTQDFYAVFRLSQDDFSDVEHLVLTCPISMHSRINTSTGVQYVANPEEELVNITISFFNNPLGTYGSNVVSKLEGTRNNDFLMEGTIISDAKKILDIGASVCNLINLYNQIVGAVASVGATAGAFGADITGLEAAVKSLQIGNMGNFLDIGAEICEFAVGCKHSKEIIQDSLWQAPGIADIQAGLDSAATVKLQPQPKDSLILSTLTLCAPGIVNNLEKLRGIECAYSRCVLQSVQDGSQAIYDDTIPALCRRERDYQNCKFVTGEIFNAIPYTAVAKQIGQQLEAIFADPLSLGFSAVMIACPNIPGLTASSVCILTATIFEWTSIIGQVNDFERNFDFDSITGENECAKFKEEYDEVFG